MRAWPAWCGLAMALVLAAAPAAAEVEVLVRSDGSRWVRNRPAAEAPAPRRPATEPRATERPAAEPATLPADPAAPAPGAVPSTIRLASRTSETPDRSTAVPAARLDPPGEHGRALALDRIVAEQAAAQGLDPALVHAVIRAESAGNRLAVSRVGAMGLMQLMPATAAELAVADPWDETENVRGGAAYLKQMLDRFERLDLALAAYNAGPSAVERHGAVPPYRETVDYVRRVLGTYHGRPVALSEIRIAPSYVPPAAPAGRAGSAPLLLRDASGRLHLTNAGPSRAARALR